MMSENLVQSVLDAQQGNEDSFAKLYSRTLKNSYYLSLKLTSDNEAAEDVLKKGYANAFCSINKLKRPEAFEVWLKQKIAAAYKVTQSFVFNDADGDAETLSAEFLPESVLEDDSICRRIEDYVAYLPAEQRTAIVLHYFVGMPVEIIAKFLSVSTSTVNSLLAKARESIIQPLELNDVTLSESSIPVLTRIFQRSSSEICIDNELVRKAFIYAVDCYNGNENPVDESIYSPEINPVSKEIDSDDEKLDNRDDLLNADEEETIIIDEGVKASQSVTGDDLIKEISKSISDLDLDSTTDNSSAIEGVYISKSSDNDDNPAQEDLPIRSNKSKDKNSKTKIAIIGAVALLIVVAIIGAIVFSKRNPSTGEELSTDMSTVDVQSVKQEFREIAEFNNYEISYFNETCALIKDKETGKYGLMDYQGNIKLNPEFFEISRCSYGRSYSDTNKYHYVVKLENGSTDVFDVNMSTFEISPVPHSKHSTDSDAFDLSKKYSERDRYHNGYAAVKDAETGKWGYILESNQKLVIPCNYETVNDGLPIDEYQKVDYCLAVDNGMVAVKKGEMMGIITVNNDVVVNFEYQSILQGSGGVFIACKNNKWGVILVGDAVDAYSANTAAVVPISKDIDKILEEYEALEGNYKATQELNIRTEIGASTDDSIIQTVEFGTVLKAVAEGTASNGKQWICVELDNGYGWVSAKYLQKVYD